MPATIPNAIERERLSDYQFHGSSDGWMRCPSCGGCKKETRLLTETNREMSKDTIIFFDKLGFGWVIDKIAASELKMNSLNEDLFNKSLIKIIENLLDHQGI